MRAGESRVGQGISFSGYGAWLFDLDGVVTDTAGAHAAAWKETFDGYLRLVADRDGTPFTPFEVDPDYGLYVDGRPRFEGVDAFLRSRGIELPWGSQEDPPGRETVCGIGNRKNEVFKGVLEERGVRVFATSVVLIRSLKASGTRVAVVTSSRNREAVLASAGIGGLFDAAVDGNVAAAKGLAGKPAPDTFLEAAGMLGIPPEGSVVVEDALAGVAAGRAGGFGLVVGVAREGHPGALYEGGADVVVGDLAEIRLDEGGRE